MNYFRILVLLSSLHQVAFADAAATPCEKWPSSLRFICLRPYQTWTQGNNELYLSGYAWHNRYYYDSERARQYNELAYGGGLGKSFYDEKGNWHGLFAIAFLDSHKNVEPTAGYAYLKVLHLSENARVGLGYSILVTQRPDINSGTPFAGALPWMSINYRRFSISGTYIPGYRKNMGNVLFALMKWVL